MSDTETGRVPEGAGEHVRPITESDWPRIARLEAEAYAGTALTEGETALRAHAAHPTSFVLETDGRITGYVLTLPYPRFRCPELGAGAHGRGVRGAGESAGYAGGTGDLGAAGGLGVPEAGGNLHLHDLVVSAPLRRRGRGSALVAHLTRAAGDLGHTTISLVALAGRERFWRANGYQPHPGTPLPAGYGPGAVYMSVRVAVPEKKEAVRA
ncbi:GNAT family N-acetyltransferase [Streptomyces sp. J2-1]|uniref:GNAT family N-acetyltransferase n=1 Tax=Streptomyces corallincola TaxID=2851888 RepID=UPI001C3862AD|nr:GNAT family N-acetyltransferase [Streptomyces corallincola]MBV2355189.1 GNAT family N-acetyltransferase [Streptomyces corallincola]